MEYEAHGGANSEAHEEARDEARDEARNEARNAVPDEVPFLVPLEAVPEAVYFTLKSAEEFCKEWAGDHNFALVRSRSKSGRKAGDGVIKIWLHCDRGSRRLERVNYKRETRTRLRELLPEAS
ncbi:hypothetical protein K402DRAFT_424415 [Aulographum hederae CBS 113979]|uniref:FAR1 domain-containing protein n=1 Tax=Aulographum hederae CBS 113979 TaxID=1176131 RepID=A0A6G1GP19_9PEZI|nr:hypothetical protein K402DRAFT_424415 [Aulographum hederae CBS 113979]